MSRRPRLAQEFALLRPEFEVAVRAASASLTAAGIRHALCGGLAIGAYARPRATADIDFLVGEEAFPSMGSFVGLHPAIPIRLHGIAVDVVPLEPQLHGLEEFLVGAELDDGIPVVPVLALVAMKLVAGRFKDQADVVALVEAGSVDVDAARDFLRAHGFAELVSALDTLVEKSGLESGFRPKGKG